MSPTELFEVSILPLAWLGAVACYWRWVQRFSAAEWLPVLSAALVLAALMQATIQERHFADEFDQAVARYSAAQSPSESSVASHEENIADFRKGFGTQPVREYTTGFR